MYSANHQKALLLVLFSLLTVIVAISSHISHLQSRIFPSFSPSNAKDIPFQESMGLLYTLIGAITLFMVIIITVIIGSSMVVVVRRRLHIQKRQGNNYVEVLAN